MGVSNPYRLKPLLGARVPVNTSYSPIISMHNPFSNSLHVVEMFSSGGSLHLELPTGAAEASHNMWVSVRLQTQLALEVTPPFVDVHRSEEGYLNQAIECIVDSISHFPSPMVGKPIMGVRFSQIIARP